MRALISIKHILNFDNRIKFIFDFLLPLSLVSLSAFKFSLFEYKQQNAREYSGQIDSFSKNLLSS